MLLRYRLLYVFMLALASVQARAQVPTGFIHVHDPRFVDEMGIPVSNATVCWQAKIAGTGFAPQVGGGGHASKPPVCSPVNNGIFDVNVADTNLTKPENVCFAVTITSDITGDVLLDNGYECVQPTSAAPTSGSPWCTTLYGVTTCDFSLYQTNLPSLAVIQPGPTGLQGPVGPQGPQGAQGLSGSVGASGSNGALQESNGAGGLTSHPVPQQEYKTVSNSSMATFQNALDNCQSQIVPVLFLWDSRGVVSDDLASLTGSTDLDVPFGQRTADLFRKELQHRCPSHGTGLIPVLPTIPYSFTNYPVWNASSEVTNGFTALGPFLGSQGGVTVFGAGTTLSFGSELPWDTLEVFCATDLTSTPIAVLIDGVSMGNACTGSSTAASVWTSANVGLGLHVATFTTASRGLIYGAKGDAGAVGVEVSNLSVGSAPMEWFSQYPATQFAFSDLIPSQALVITDMLANEPGQGISTAQYQTSLQNLITHEQALSPAPSLLFFSPLQDGIAGQAPYYPLMKSIAQSNGIGFLDMRDRVGSAFNAAFFGPDTFHENRRGAAMGYDAILASTLTSKSSPSYTSAAPPGEMLSGYTPHGAPIYVAPEAPAGTCGTGYAAYVPLTIPASLVKENVRNFPVALLFNGIAANSITLTDLRTTANSGKVQAAGLDIIACSAASGGTQYPHELVAGSYVATTGTAEMYVRVPGLSTTTATTLYLFIGNPLAADTSRSAQVWSNGYAAVYHAGGAALAGYFSDSTGNGNTLTGYGANYTAISGNFGTGYGFTPAGGLLNSAPKGLAINNDARTVEGWFKMGSCPSSYDGFLFGYGNFTKNGSFGLDCNTGGTYPTYRTETNASIAFASVPLDTNWHFAALSLSQGDATRNITTFVDGTSGVVDCTPSVSHCLITTKTQNAPIILNGDASLGGEGVTDTVDEVRYSTVARSPGWLNTQYNNFTNPSAFVTPGTEVAAPNAPFTGTCPSTTTLTVKGGIITGCS